MNKMVGQFMIRLMKAVQRAKDEAVFCTFGGKLVYTTMTSRSCSVKYVFLDDFENKKDAKKGNAKNNFWTFTSLLRKYELYASASNKNGTEWKNFYTWASEDSVRNKEIIPSFFGYKQRSTWPLQNETYPLQTFCSHEFIETSA